eukprot:m.209602 g.209602  ORF g.209602 m.209602 type:complete len:333 (+) comp39727_c0_seq56:596-1594(+)
MKANKGLEFIWRGSKSLGKARDMWVHVLDSHYCTPNVIAFGGGVVLQADDQLPTYETNMQKTADAFMRMARERMTWYRHNHLLIPFGCDFAFQNAEANFYQMDRLMEYVNNQSSKYNATVRYGTLYDYAQAVHALNLTWEVRGGDFFPYATSPEQYWTGYYTSRPKLKGEIRSRAALLRMVETIYSLAAQKFDFDRETAYEKIDVLRRAVAVTQHHDAVTGTETLDVLHDYETMLNAGAANAEQVVRRLLAKMTAGDSQMPPLLSLNASVLCSLKQGQSVAVILYNSLGWQRTNYVSIAVNRSDFIVTDTSGKPVPLMSFLGMIITARNYIF